MESGPILTLTKYFNDLLREYTDPQSQLSILIHDNPDEETTAVHVAGLYNQGRTLSILNNTFNIFSMRDWTTQDSVMTYNGTLEQLDRQLDGSLHAVKQQLAHDLKQ
jgi:hypothetical protein